MSANMGFEGWVFIIDTNKYSGNFEREMCAYCTGLVGECEVGKEAQKSFMKDFNLENEEETIFLNVIADPADNCGCHRPCSIWITPGWSNNGGGKNTKGPGRYPAYQSVAIFFFHKPTKEMIDIIKERAEKFGKTHKIKILGFRLGEQKQIFTEETVN